MNIIYTDVGFCRPQWAGGCCLPGKGWQESVPAGAAPCSGWRCCHRGNSARIQIFKSLLCAGTLAAEGLSGLGFGGNVFISLGNACVLLIHVKMGCLFPLNLP